MIQLPAYLCMLHAAGFKDLHDAALVELRDKGREYWLFGPRLDWTMANASVNALTSSPCCSGIWSTALISPAVRAKVAAGATIRHFAMPDRDSGLVKIRFFW